MEWRIVTASSPASWHEEQRKEHEEAALVGHNYCDIDDTDEDEDDELAAESKLDFVDPMPDARWLTFVTEHGEVLGFQIVKELS